MDSKTYDMFLSWSRCESYKYKLASTRERIKSWVNQTDRISVSVSGGKDSLTMLDLILKERADVFVWHWDYGIYMPRKFEKEIQAILVNYFQIKNMKIDKRKSLNQEASIGYREFFGKINHHIIFNQIEYNFIGLRTEESCKRALRCENYLEPVKIKDYFYYNVFPIKDWAWKDVWAYIISNEIPYPEAYDKRGAFIGWDQVRFVTFFDPEFQHLGGTVQDKFFFWDQRFKV